VARSAEVRQAIPALAELASGIGDQMVRNMGTLGGSIAHADPAACYPAATSGCTASAGTWSCAGECRTGSTVCRGAVLVLEPGMVDGALKTWRKGVGDFRVSVHGRAAHAGGDHQNGRNAIEEMAHQILAIQSMTDYKKGTTLNVGVVQGGTRPNVVPDEAHAQVDLRVIDPVEAERAGWERERIMSTGMQFGIAIPHGRTFAADRLVCAVGLRPEGVEFGALDGKPARIVVLVLAPLRSAAPPSSSLASPAGSAAVQVASTCARTRPADRRRCAGPRRPPGGPRCGGLGTPRRR
jgi:hypothetical protein